jgi:hypothetical protein
VKLLTWTLLIRPLQPWTANLEERQVESPGGTDAGNPHVRMRRTGQLAGGRLGDALPL